MATNPINPALPADLPENWVYGDTVSPNGTETGLTPQHGYNYLMQQVNAAQEAANALGEAMEDVPQLEDGKIPASQLPIGTPGGAASLDESGKVPASQLPPMDYVPTSEKGAAGGVATLDSSGKLKEAQKPAYTAAEVGAIANPAGGTTGQVLTKTDGGAAWGDAPQTGITQEQADARYLQLSGGTISGPVTMNNVFKVYDGYIDAIQITSSEGNLILGASSVVTLAPTAKTISVSNSRILSLASPVNDTDAATKAYVDSKASNWVKAATHTQYDEWHLAVEGGTFVKLVANKRINLYLFVQRPGSNYVAEATTMLELPTLEPQSIITNVLDFNNITIAGSTGIFGVRCYLGGTFELQGAAYVINTESDATSAIQTGGYIGQLLVEYFVPA